MMMATAGLASLNTCLASLSTCFSFPTIPLCMQTLSFPVSGVALVNLIASMSFDEVAIVRFGCPFGPFICLRTANIGAAFDLPICLHI